MRKLLCEHFIHNSHNHFFNDKLVTLTDNTQAQGPYLNEFCWFRMPEMYIPGAIFLCNPSTVLLSIPMLLISDTDLLGIRGYCSCFCFYTFIVQRQLLSSVLDIQISGRVNMRATLIRSMFSKITGLEAVTLPGKFFLVNVLLGFMQGSLDQLHVGILLFC